MRFVAAALFLLLVAAVVWSFAVAPDRGWWMPKSASASGDEVDRLFLGITGLLAAAFTLSVGGLAWIVWRGTRSTSARAARMHGNTRLELSWTVVTGAILLVVALVQISSWERMQSGRSTADRPFARVVAAQWDWRFRYPGPDGRFDTSDDFETPYRLVVPAGERIVLELRSRDVIHGFFVPALRLKQDVLPGSALTTAFVARERGEHDLLCSQLCGAGHYRMAGRLSVVPRAEFETWAARATAEWNSNGQENP